MLASLTPSTLLQVVGSTAAIYLFVLVLLRTIGRRQLLQLTVIDLVVVLTIGSAVETAMIHGNKTLLAGLVSATTLLVINALITRLLLKSRRWRHLVNGGPVLLVHDGHPLDSHLERVGMTHADLFQALRGKGYDRLQGVRYAVLEVDGDVTVVPTTAS